MKDPPIRALFIAANNPAVTNPDTVGTRAGLSREDLFTVVHDQVLTDTVRFADVDPNAGMGLELRVDTHEHHHRRPVGEKDGRRADRHGR